MQVKELNRSKSNPGAKPYETLYDTETGTSSCTCRGWTTKKEGKPRECTHTRAIEAKHASSRPAVTEERVFSQAAVADLGFAPAATVEPMLASAMTRGQTLADFEGRAGWVMEEKFDGHRQVVTVRGGEVLRSRSRAGNDRTLPAHVREALAHLPDGIYDGELVVPGGMSSDVTRGDRAGQLALVLFDVLEVLGRPVTGLAYRERRALLQVALAHVGAWRPGCAAVAMAEAMPVSRAAVEAIWARGGEGCILKREAARYQPGYRSADWVKVKKEIPVVVTVTGFATGDTGIAFGKTLVRDDAGREFSIKTKDNATLRAVAADTASFVGRRLVVKCNEVLASGAYRHAMWDHFAGEGE